ncbi:T9SS type B sorting domain-containing protein [Ulvibacter antarcticus]|uniref:Gliding motility-associated-like protein n=1 Tax=Ulvibacter antarcticus TaxID=442714 RepID=A0A3L9YD26_9FLAO|nr:gliding motility-associated C-terminal domain-containing protein [Ulvibacter antarcticus]RMA58551.1 gliding motility-associated-like protein [Ulvibacter antarcticus]
MLFLRKILLLLLCLSPVLSLAQEIELFQQFNGRYDYLSFGNTLNLVENSGGTTSCEILTESSAELALLPGQTLVAAYLYWAGVGDGDLEVKLNDTNIIATRNFTTTFSGLSYFAAYADVTSIIANFGSANYTLSDLDLSDILSAYCSNRTNFGGWAINVVYEDASLTLNQLTIFDGLENVSSTTNEISIILENLNVLDNSGAKVGFLAWEGDENIAVSESLLFNGNVISNPPLNPADNAFNGTNSFTNSSELYNMDMDFYFIENNINPGDTSAVITLRSGQDFVMINNIITVLNTELPDATIQIDNVAGGTECGNREIEVDYTVYNINATDELPGNTAIAFYANNTLVGQSATSAILPIDGSESGTIVLDIPLGVSPDFLLKAVVDDDGFGNGSVNEINETNNDFEIEFHLKVFPEIIGLQNLELCDVLGIELFDLSEATAQIDPLNAISYHLSEADANSNLNPIVNPQSFQNTTNPQTIWIRVSNPDCFVIDSYSIEVIVCALPDATIVIEDNLFACRSRPLSVPYTVYNTDGTAILPANTPLAFYVEDLLLGQSHTQNNIPIGGSESGSIELILPDSTPDTFTIKATADDVGNGTGIIFELNDENNSFEITTSFGSIPPIPSLPDLLECNKGNQTSIFDLTALEELISEENSDIISFFTTLEDAIGNSNEIQDPEHFESTANPQTIFVRLENEICFTTASFLLKTENCPPIIYDGVSPNNDGSNDVFIIEQLLDVYENFELFIYSRDGNLIYKGGNEDGFWNAIPNTGLLYRDSLVPVGTYYYALILNDPQFPEPFTGFIYVNY